MASSDASNPSAAESMRRAVIGKLAAAVDEIEAYEAGLANLLARPVRGCAMSSNASSTCGGSVWVMTCYITIAV